MHSLTVEDCRENLKLVVRIFFAMLFVGRTDSVLFNTGNDGPLLTSTLDSTTAGLLFSHFWLLIP